MHEIAQTGSEPGTSSIGCLCPNNLLAVYAKSEKSGIDSPWEMLFLDQGSHPGPRARRNNWIEPRTSGSEKHLDQTLLEAVSVVSPHDWQPVESLSYHQLPVSAIIRARPLQMLGPGPLRTHPNLPNLARTPPHSQPRNIARTHPPNLATLQPRKDTPPLPTLQPRNLARTHPLPSPMVFQWRFQCTSMAISMQTQPKITLFRLRILPLLSRNGDSSSPSPSQPSPALILSLLSRRRRPSHQHPNTITKNPPAPTKTNRRTK